ncbi:hypothetical protein G6F40_017685 [Rhizopus arrhizus]|nr:hypothetical protein G6F40_017685 [Rhizopus arrhizus]
MPQTREHLAILSLLGVAQGAVALTKTDRADAAQQAAVRAEIAALAAGTFLAGAPGLKACTSATAPAGARASIHWLRPSDARSRVHSSASRPCPCLSL